MGKKKKLPVVASWPSVSTEQSDEADNPQGQKTASKLQSSATWKPRKSFSFSPLDLLPFEGQPRATEVTGHHGLLFA